MKAFVVDTNVPVVANGRSSQADDKCVIACVDALQEIYQEAMIVLDETMLILDEYMRNLSMAGQPGAGDYFMKWVWTIQADSRRCERVDISALDNSGQFLGDADLNAFDRSDRKFAAVALASKASPTVLNAVDTDWAKNHAALTRHGVKITYLCPQCVSP